MLTEFEARDPVALDPALVEETRAHPIRVVTRAAAAEVGAWTPETARRVRGVFDRLAPEWHTRHTPDRLEAIADALERGLGALPASVDPEGWCLELGCGDGWGTPALAARFPRLLAVDLSLAMLETARAGGRAVAPQLQADGAALPLPDHRVATAVLANMLLFPFEIDRVLALDGVLVWVSSRSEATPIWLPPADVVRALPGRWGGTWARCGTATWAVLHRLGAQPAPSQAMEQLAPPPVHSRPSAG